MKGQRSIVITTFLCIKYCTAGNTYFVNEQSTAVLRCPFKAASWFGPPKHTIYTRDTLVNPKLPQKERLNVTGSENFLLISNVQHADAGEYRCIGSNNGASLSSYIQLVLTDAPDLYPTIQQIPTGSIMTGNTIRLTCTVSGGNPLPTLSWNCSGTSINNTSGDTAAYSVTFTVDEKFNNKICTCSATHPVSSYRPNVQHTLVVYYAPDSYPTIQQIPAGSIITGNTIRLTCTVSGGNPLPSLSWNCSGTIINQTLGDTAALSVTFTVEKSFNNNICTCSATHPVSSYRPNVQHTLVVYYAPDSYPTIQQIPAGSIITGNTISLTCTVSDGNPLPTLSWNCSGTIINNTSGDTAAYSVTFTVEKTFNNKICTCLAKHPVSSYIPSVQHTLVVYCFDLYK